MSARSTGTARLPVLLTIAVILVSSALLADSRKKGTGQPASRPAAEAGMAERGGADAHLKELGDTVALLPWSYRNGKEAAVQSAREVCNQLLLETGFNVFLIKSVTGAMPPAMPNDSSKRAVSPLAHLMDDGQALIGKTLTGPANQPFPLPTEEQMTEIGLRLKTRYVLAGRAQWSTRNVWVGIGNRAKSMCTVDLLVLDTASRQLVLDARNVQGDSTENKNMFNSIASAVSLNPLPLILPGSVTPQEQRAVSIATEKALEPWLKKQRLHFALAQADLSSELANESELKFSNLLMRANNLTATLHVNELDEKQSSVLDPDEVRLFAGHTVNLRYSEPGRLTLTSEDSKSRTQTLLFDDNMRRFSMGLAAKSGGGQDTSNSPARLLSLVDFLGMLTPDMFDTMRARFVRVDENQGMPAAVYDLSYWRADDTSYQRVWIDMTTHLVVHRDVFDKNSKLKAVYLYEQPHRAGVGLWYPQKVEIQSPLRKRVAVLTVSDVQTTQDMQP